MKIENRLNVLRGMENKGHITLHKDTGKLVRHWTGRLVKAYYISFGEREFIYKGKTYQTRCIDGCFHPFVVLMNDGQKISFV